MRHGLHSHLTTRERRAPTSDGASSNARPPRRDVRTLFRAPYIIMVFVSYVKMREFFTATLTSRVREGGREVHSRGNIFAASKKS